MEKKFSVAIIGSGTAGLNALGQVSQKTKDFILINGGEFGTTCARVGCMPSKVLIQIAEDFHRRDVFKRHAIEGGESLKLDLAEAMEHVRDLRDSFVDRVLGSSTDNMPAEKIMRGYARFITPNRLEMDNGDIVEADKIIIATGSTPIVPTPWAKFGDRILTTDTFFEQATLPETVAVIGLGVIGLEIGQSLHRMGVKVVGIDQADHIGGLKDPEVNKVAIDTLKREFPLWLGAAADISETADGKLKVTAGDNSIIVDKVFASLGRRPNLDKLGLDNLGLKLNALGLPDYNPNTAQVGDLPIFIAGDVNNNRPILHEAGQSGKIAGFNATRDTPMAFQLKTPLNITFCDPNIISVGQSYDSLDLDKTAIGEVRLALVGRALIMANNRGMMRVYANKADGKLLGAEMMSVRGEHLAHQLNWAIEQGLTVFDVLSMPFYHPVIEEGMQGAFYALLKEVDAKQFDYPLELKPV